jgi:hypothetical protein
VSGKPPASSLAGGLPVTWAFMAESDIVKHDVPELPVVNNAHGGQLASNGHLLYTFISDRPGQATGQGVQDFFVATPGIAQIAETPAPTGAVPASPSSGGYGY